MTKVFKNGEIPTAEDFNTFFTDLQALQVAAQVSQNGASASQAAAAAFATNALAAAAVLSVYANGAASNVPRGLTQASVGTITPGTGGSNGTFALSWSGGNFTINPTGTFTVAGGVVTAVTITGPGQYIGSTPTVPTPSFTASTGLTGAAVVLTAQFLVSSGQGYWVQSADGLTLDRYNNVSGVATRDTSVSSIQSGLPALLAVGDIYASVSKVVIGATTPTGSTNGSTGILLGPRNATASDGFLKSMSVRINVLSTPCSGEWHIQKPDGASPTGWTTLAITSVTGLVAGVNTFTGSSIYAGLVPSGSRIYFKQNTSSQIVVASPGTTILGVSFTQSGTQVVGSPTTGTYNLTYANDVGISVTMLYSSKLQLDDRVATNEVTLANLGPRVTTNETNITALQTKALARLNKIVAEMFAGTSLPSGWTTVGGTWTANNSLIPPAAGGAVGTCYAVAPSASSLSQKKITARFVVTNTASIFGICSLPQEAVEGAIAMVDGTLNRLTLYHWTGSSTSNTTFVALSTGLVAGHAYIVDVERNWYATTITVKDATTQTVLATISDNVSSYTNRQFHGRPGVMFVSGAVSVEWFDFSSMKPQDCRVLILGDSRTDGAYLTPFGSKTWARLLADGRQLENDVVVAARSGDETPNLLGRLTYDLQAWKPKYVLVFIGTNDPNFAGWRTNMTTIVAQIVALGAEPIFCTETPDPASPTLVANINADYKARYFGPYRYIDFAAAVSLNNDGVNWNPTYNSGDDLHPSVSGQQRMYQQLLIDAPFVAR